MNATDTSSQEEKKTILVVDVDPAVLSLVAQLLAGKNHNVITANGGADALRKSREFTSEIHLLVSDFRMPDMSGVELATAISSERPNVKVLLMSGFAAEVAA